MPTYRVGVNTWAIQTFRTQPSGGAVNTASTVSGAHRPVQAPPPVQLQAYPRVLVTLLVNTAAAAPFPPFPQRTFYVLSLD